MEAYLIVCPLLFLAGLVDSIAGGGGLISLPAYLLAGLPPHLALGTNKFSSTMGTTVSTVRFALNGYVKPRMALVCVIMAFIGSTIGSHLALLVSETVVKDLMIVVLPIVAFYVLRNKKLSSEEAMLETRASARSVYIAGTAALIVGCYDGFYGPGTGTFLLLILTGWAKFGLRTAAGLTKVTNLTSNVAALITFLLNAKVYFPLAIAGAVFNILGNYIGSGMMLSNAKKYVRPIIIVVLALLFIKILWQK